MFYSLRRLPLKRVSQRPKRYSKHDGRRFPDVPGRNATPEIGRKKRLAIACTRWFRGETPLTAGVNTRGPILCLFASVFVPIFKCHSGAVLGLLLYTFGYDMLRTGNTMAEIGRIAQATRSSLYWLTKCREAALVSGQT